MKPSERIQEIFSAIVKDEKDINYLLNALNRAIMKFLDEEWSKNQCDHRWESPESLDQLNVCRNCSKVEN